MQISKLFSFSQWSLRARVSALVAVPLLCITLLTVYNINSALSRETASLEDRVEKLLFLAADAAQLALFAGDSEALDNLAAAIMRDSQIAELLFFDDAKQQLSGQPATIASKVVGDDFVDGKQITVANHWVFVRSVKPMGAFIDDDPEQYQEPVSQELLGWVLLTVDLSKSRDYRAAVLRNNLLIAALMLSIALWLAFRFSRAVVRPINKITDAVARYGQEDFNHRVAELSSGELGELEKGINKLAERVGQSQLILKAEVEKATNKWVAAAKDLERQNLDLAEAKTIAVEANHAKDDFLARMSHELRTPLTGIMGFVRLLAKTDQPKLRQEYSDIILTSSKVLLSTINDILDFSKLRANSFELNPSRFNLETCLCSALDLHRVSAFEKGLELNVLIDSDVPLELVADVDKLQKVLNNILSNAVKFTEAGDIIVFVTLLEQQGDAAVINIAIKDSGIGISAANLQRLFNPFFQCDESSTRSHDGTGLGLSIAEDFVTLMGGHISIDSEQGEGTEVSFSFLCQFEQSAAKAFAVGGSWRALIYDRNPWTRRSWRNQLLKYSSDVCVLASADKLLASLSQQPKADLLLLGFNAQLDSYTELSALLQSIRATYKGVILLATADVGNSQIIELSETYSPCNLLSKPLTHSRLWAALAKANEESAAAFISSSNSLPSLKDKTLNSPRLPAGLAVLVADDNPFNQRLLRTLLQAAGAQVTVVSNGQEAQRLCARQRFDVLILDLHMPKLNGMQVSEAVRKGQLNKQTPIVILTADARAAQQPAMAAAGVDAVSYKPLDEQDLMAKIQRLATPREVEAEPASTRALVTLAASDIEAELDLQLQAIAKALLAKDIAAVQQQVHQLLGVIGLSGIDSLKQVAAELSLATSAGDMAAVSRHYERLAADCAAITA